MKGNIKKIPVGFTYNSFSKLETKQKKDLLLKYLTSDALSIFVNQIMTEEKVPRTSFIIDCMGLYYLRIAENLFEFFEEETEKCKICGRTLSEKKYKIKFLEGSLVCTKKCYFEIKNKQSKQLYRKTGVKLKEFKKIHKEWQKKAPFHQEIPSEIMFVQSDEEEIKKGDFYWKISIPDFLDQYYWPLQKKEMTSINLYFSKNEQNQNKTLV